MQKKKVMKRSPLVKERDRNDELKNAPAVREIVLDVAHQTNADGDVVLLIPAMQTSEHFENTIEDCVGTEFLPAAIDYLLNLSAMNALSRRQVK